ARVGVRAAHDAEMQHVRQRKVVEVASTADHEGAVFLALERLSDDVHRIEGLLRPSWGRDVNHGGGVPSVCRAVLTGAAKRCYVFARNSVMEESKCRYG